MSVERVASSIVISIAASLVACSGSLEGSPADDASTRDANDDARTVDSSTGDAASDGDATALDAPALDTPDTHVLAAGGTYYWNLGTAPFPSTTHPDVAVHVPKGFDPWNRPGLVVYFHGFSNCVTNAIASVDGTCPPDTGTRAAMHLVDQLDAAKVNAVLVAIELSYDQATGAPGQLANAGDFHALLHELLTEHLDAEIGRPLDVEDLDRVVVTSHSGGYWATAEAISVGGVANVTEVGLFDSLYGNFAEFGGWMKTNVVRFDTERADTTRWGDVYTCCGGTAANSRDMAADAGPLLDAAGLSRSFLFDDTTDSLEAGVYGAKPVIYKLSALAHDDVPRYYFQPFVETAGFQPIP